MTTIKDRFFFAIDTLMKQKVITRKGFCREINIDHSNFIAIHKGRGGREMKVQWLSTLVEKYNISPEWLLTGKGEMFNK